MSAPNAARAAELARRDAAIRRQHDQRIRQALDDGAVSAAKLLDQRGARGDAARQPLEVAAETLHARQDRRLTRL